MTRYRSLRRGVAVAAAVSLLTGCGGLPSRTDVTQGLPVDPQVLPHLRFRFEPPSPGASPENIVRGFLRAGSHLGDEDRTAQAYLTAEAWDRWQHQRGVTVYAREEQLTVHPTGPDAVEVRVVATAEVGADGRYRELPGGTVRRSRMRLTKEAGEWRISDVDAELGRWVQEFYFAADYRPLRLAYVAERGSSLLFDVRWLPFDSTVTTALARAQLEPVPDHLAGTAVTGFPAGTALGVDSVGTEDRTAIVQLTSRAIEADPTERRQMWAQMLTTMTQIPHVGAVSLRADGRPLELVGLPRQPTNLADLGLAVDTVRAAGSVVLRRGATLSIIDRNELTSDAGAKPPAVSASNLPAVPAGWAELAAPTDLSEVAAVSADRRHVRRWRSGSGERVSSELGTALVRPSFDENGMWVGGRDASGRTRLWHSLAGGREEGSPRPVEAPWLEGQVLVAARATRDGRRLATVTARGETVRVGISGVQRLPDGTPTSVNAPIVIGGAVTEATDLAWVDDDTLAVIGRRGPGAPLGPVLVGLDGTSREMPPLAGAQSVRSLGGFRGLLVQTKGGEVYLPSGNGWRRVAAGIDGLIIPGG